MAEALAERAALAIENGRLYQTACTPPAFGTRCSASSPTT